MSVFTNETWLSHNFLMGSGVVAHVVYKLSQRLLKGSGVVAHVVYTILPPRTAKQP